MLTQNFIQKQQIKAAPHPFAVSWFCTLYKSLIFYSLSVILLLKRVKTFIIKLEYGELFKKGSADMLKVYCYSKCSTCKKALKWLDEKKIKYEVADIKDNHPDEETLRKYYAMSGIPLKRFFNTSGMQYRELELSKKLPGMSEDEQFILLASDGMLVKRPLLVGKNLVLAGFKPTEWEEKLL